MDSLALAIVIMLFAKVCLEDTPGYGAFSTRLTSKIGYWPVAVLLLFLIIFNIWAFLNDSWPIMLPFIVIVDVALLITMYGSYKHIKKNKNK